MDENRIYEEVFLTEGKYVFKKVTLKKSREIKLVKIKMINRYIFTIFYAIFFASEAS